VIRWKPKGSSLLELLAFLPYAVPGIAMGFAFMVAFLSFPNPIYGTLWIIMLAYLTTFLPIGTRFTHAAITQVRAELEEAAATSGAGLFDIMRHILIPLILPSLVSGGLYLFLLCVKVVSAASILWNPDSVILSVYVLQLWGEGRLPVVSALSVVTIVFLTLLFLMARLLAVRRSVAAEISF
jgi:iron(III) transport system permease protein